MGFTTLSLKGRALRWLGQREHSRSELLRKLAPHAQEGDDLDALLSELESKGFISEARVLDSVVHRKASRMGAARIRQELHAKGLDPEAIQGAVAQLQATEADRARAVWSRRFSGPPADARERLRQMRFLAARGFASDVVRKVVPPALG